MSIQSRLSTIVNDTETKAGRAFDLTIQTLIILSLLSFSFETLPNLSSSASKFLRLFEIVSVSIFTVEYIARLYVAPKKLALLFSFYGMIDHIAILPFYVAAKIDLRSVRAFRPLRLIRIFKPSRYGRAVASLTTVGYGDIFPITAGGKTFTNLILFMGLGVIAIPAGSIASALNKVASSRQP